MNNIVIVSLGTGKYLFSLPDSVTLREGDRVKCSTKRGITDGVAFSDSAWVDENVSQLIGKLTGAKFPLKPVVGKMEYRSFDKPQDKPANKYEGMLNLQLKTEMCSRGPCHVCNDGRRKHDCLFADSDCPDVTDANRAEVIKYLLAEDAEADPEPEGKPTEDKREPIKLYCVKDYGSTLTGGKTYDFVDGLVKYDGGQKSSWHMNAKEFCEAVNENTGVDSIFPLVKRPAKVGEWVLLDRDDCFHRNKKGDIAEVIDAPFHTRDFCFINDPTHEYGGGICVNFESNYSYVLDGYHAEAEPEPEAEPEYFSGKVVCVSSGDECFIVGKMYEFINGEVKDDEGDSRPMHADERFKSVDEWNSEYGMPIARFIEFKGEAK